MGKKNGERSVKKKAGDIKAQAFDEMADAFKRYDEGWYEKEEKEVNEK